MKTSSYERRCAGLQAAVSAQEGKVADAERRMRQDEKDRESFGREVARLQAENRRLQQELEAASAEKRALESRVTELASELDRWKALQGRPVAVLNEGPLPNDYRLPNGTPIQPLFGKGNGLLEVKNQGTPDAIIKLVRLADRQCISMFYVRSGETFPQAGIPDGSYTLYYATGYDYDYGSRDFKRGRQTRKCDSPFEFTSRTIKNTFTMGVPFGNVTSTRVPGAEFDSYSPIQ